MKSALHIETLPVGQMHANCYLIADNASKECIIIDPGDDTDFITSKIQSLQVLPKVIIATHGHFDHIMSAYDMQLIYNIPFLIHQEDVFLIERMEETAKHFLGMYIESKKPKPSNFLQNQEKIAVGDQEFMVIHTPGHTPGSICLFNEHEHLLFTGDTLFAQGNVGRTDFSYSSSQELQDSLRKLWILPNITTLYPGHETSSTIGNERQFFAV